MDVAETGLGMYYRAPKNICIHRAVFGRPFACCRIGCDAQDAVPSREVGAGLVVHSYASGVVLAGHKGRQNTLVAHDAGQQAASSLSNKLVNKTQTPPNQKNTAGKARGHSSCHD